MAFRFNCGKPEQNEVAALNRLAAELTGDWALFTSIPRHITGQGSKGREIDALALSPLGAVVIELKNFGGLITITPVGEWLVGGQLLTDRNGRPQYPIQQAGKAAQTLKSALGDGLRSVYIEACSIATAPSARIQFADPSRPQPVMAMHDAVASIEALARKTRGVSYPALQAFFSLIGHEIPPALDARWQASPPANARKPHSSQRRKPPVHSDRRPNHFDYSRHQQRSSPLGWWLPLAIIAGSLLGGLILTISNQN